MLANSIPYLLIFPTP